MFPVLRWGVFVLAAGSLGCQPTPSAPVPPSPTALIQANNGEMLSAALKKAPCNVPACETVTVELVRRSPEGATRELIQCDRAMNLKNPSDDRALRKGDAVVLPSSQAVPAGLERPSAIAVTDAN